MIKLCQSQNNKTKTKNPDNQNIDYPGFLLLKMKIITEDKNTHFDQYSVESLSLDHCPYQDKGQTLYGLKTQIRAF